MFHVVAIPREGIFAKVKTGGTIRPTDEVSHIG